MLYNSNNSFFAAVNLIFYIKEKREEAKDDDNDYAVTATTPESNHKESTHMEETIGTIELVLKTIENIGGKPEFEERGHIYFGYQGREFVMHVADECKFVNLVMPWCYAFSKFDIDEFARVRRVINEINTREDVTACYCYSDFDELGVHLMKQFLFIPQIPSLDEYLRYMMESIFKAARRLDLEIEKSKIQESCQKETEI